MLGFQFQCIFRQDTHAYRNLISRHVTSDSLFHSKYGYWSIPVPATISFQIQDVCYIYDIQLQGTTFDYRVVHVHG